MQKEVSNTNICELFSAPNEIDVLKYHLILQVYLYLQVQYYFHATLPSEKNCQFFLFNSGDGFYYWLLPQWRTLMVLPSFHQYNGNSFKKCWNPFQQSVSSLSKYFLETLSMYHWKLIPEPLIKYYFLLKNKSKT